MDHVLEKKIQILFKKSYEISLCKLICKIISHSQDNRRQSAAVSLCDALFFDVFNHAACSCDATYYVRNDLWDDITNNFAISIGAELCALSDDDLFYVLLGCKTRTLLDGPHYLSFFFTKFQTCSRCSCDIQSQSF